MANIRKIEGKTGTSYKITVSSGRNTQNKQMRHYLTWTPEPGMTPKQIEKELIRVAVAFEQQCEQGYVADDRQTLAEYIEYFIAQKERGGIKHKTVTLWRYMLRDITPKLGHMKLRDIRPQLLNSFYDYLGQPGIRRGKNKAVATADLKAMIKAQGITQAAFAQKVGIGVETLRCACSGKQISVHAATVIANGLNVKFEATFKETREDEPLKAKTIREYHSFLSSVLGLAEREMIIPYNPASKAMPPKVIKAPVNYYEIDEVIAIRDALQKAPIKWQMLSHLLLVTGARRGEIGGLEWSCIDMTKKTIRIDKQLSYAPDRGVYLSEPKTASSKRIISVPEETITMLKEYRKWQLEQRLKMGELWYETDLVFTQEDGRAMHPDSITGWLNKFSQRNNLPHLNPHAFRHTMVSLLYFSGMDPVTISKRVGHSQVSTTSDVYAHIMKKADAKAAETIADAVLRTH